VRFEDAATGKVLVRLKSDRNSHGEISKVGRFIWGFHEEALPIEAHHLYRVVAEYDNPTGKNIPAGGMGHINGVFSPNDMSEWPVLDLANADIKRDIETLPTYNEMSASRASKPRDARSASRTDGHEIDADEQRSERQRVDVLDARHVPHAAARGYDAHSRQSRPVAPDYSAMHGRRHQGTIRPGGGEPLEVFAVAHAAARDEIHSR